MEVGPTEGKAAGAALFVGDGVTAAAVAMDGDSAELALGDELDPHPATTIASRVTRASRPVRRGIVIIGRRRRAAAWPGRAAGLQGWTAYWSLPSAFMRNPQIRG
jgi:hypothetical protein